MPTPAELQKLGELAFAAHVYAQSLMAPAPAPTPPAPSPAPGTRVGGNWSRADYITQQFVDLVNQSRGFGLPGSYEEGGITRDENGWPTQASQIVITGANQQVGSKVGVYKGSYRGAGNIKAGAMISASITNIVRNGDVVSFDMPVTAQAFQSIFQFDGGITDLKVLTPGYNTSQRLLTDEALAHYKQFSCLRSLGIPDCNFMKPETWGGRVPSAKWNGWPSWELPLRMAAEVFNAVDSKCKALWIVVPYWADENYMLQLARLAVNILPLGMIVYVEYSNENWNGHFPALKSIHTDANNPNYPDYPRLPGPDEWSRVQQLWGLRHARLAKIWKSMFGARCRPVLAGHVVNSYWTRKSLEYLNLTQQVNEFGTPNTYTHALAAAPYVGVSFEEYQSCTTIAQVDGFHRGNTETGLGYFPAKMAEWRKLADDNGIVEMNAYEWGIHTSPVPTDKVSLMKDYHMSPYAGAIIVDLHKLMVAAKWNLLCYLGVTANKALPNNINSLWAVRESYVDNPPKWTAVRSML